MGRMLPFVVLLGWSTSKWTRYPMLWDGGERCQCARRSDVGECRYMSVSDATKIFFGVLLMCVEGRLVRPIMRGDRGWAEAGLEYG